LTHAQSKPILLIIVFVGGGLLAYWGGSKLIIREMKKLIEVIKRGEKEFAHKMKKIGIMFIVVGFFIPLVLYPYTELTEDVGQKAAALLALHGKKYAPRLSELEVVFRDKVEGSYLTRGHPITYSKLSLRYPSIIAIGLVSIFVGISIIVLSRKRISDQKEEKQKSETPADPPSHKAERQLPEKDVKKEKRYIAVDEDAKASIMLECPECDFSVNEEEFAKSDFFCPNCKSRLEYG
jgi:hypothetical protein